MSLRPRAFQLLTALGLTFALLAACGCGGNTTETPANPISRPDNLKLGGAGGKPVPKAVKAKDTDTAQPGKLTD